MTHKMQIGEIITFIKKNIRSINEARVISKKNDTEKIVIFNIDNNTGFIDILKDKEITFKQSNSIENKAIDIEINYTEEQDNIFMKIIVMEILEYRILREILDSKTLTFTTALKGNLSITFNDYTKYNHYKILEMFLLLLEIYGIKERKDFQYEKDYEIVILKKDSNTSLEIFLEKIKVKINELKNNG